MFTKARVIMPNCIRVAEFFDTPCAAAVVASLPITARPKAWGDEFYFTVPIDMPLDETSTEQVTAGDIGYWPPGNTGLVTAHPLCRKKHSRGHKNGRYKSRAGKNKTAIG